MAEEKISITNRRLKTPRAAALAGIAFSLLSSASSVLIRLSVPESPMDSGAWLEDRVNFVSTALSLLPFAGIAFLWFLGVIRDRLGDFEDRFFSTVFFGSGLLFIAMTFVAASIAGGILIINEVNPGVFLENSMYTFSRAMMYQIINVYSLRMASVFMLSLGTIWARTKIIPRPLIFLTYGLALVLLLGLSFSQWISLVFPGWVFVISTVILILNFRKKEPQQSDEATTISAHAEKTILD
ncbi:MAG: hypothetical protein U9R53_02725 [Chloroflexota bacterium]|nr:hypothetical protein [Chloroflexota bacterium]